MGNWKFVGVAMTVAGMFALGAVWGQQRSSAEPRLSAEDHIEIEQLIYRYGHAIDTCANDGYDYADLYADDGIFIDNFSEEGFAQQGIVRAVGREALARAAGGGDLGCRNVPWKEWSHLMINPVIEATEQGAVGRVYLLVIGEQGRNHLQRFGGYEDEYVKTVDGWRIKRRIHVRNKAWSHPLLQSTDLN
jgi:hypothetical protein